MGLEQKMDREPDLEADWRKQELEENTAFRSLFIKQNGDELLCSFFKWLVHRGWWYEFWAAFRADGVMTWLEFEKFVHWDGRWTGDKRRVFKEMAIHCGTDTKHPELTAGGVLDLKRWWEDLADPGKNQGAQAVDNLRAIFAENFGNLGCAWRLALDPDDTGSCCFLVFCRVCHEMGMRKNLKTIWEELTFGHPHKSILYHDWDPVGDRLVSRFTMGLAIKYGSMREGWNRTIKNAGGHVHSTAFIEVCAELGIDMADAKWLFATLDTDRRRFLTEFDRLLFLSHWDPGHVADMTLHELQAASHKPKKKSDAQGPKSGRGPAPTPEIPFKISESNPYEFVLELNEQEHKEYQKRLKGRLLTVGQDEEAKNAAAKKQAREAKSQKAQVKVDQILMRPTIARKFNNEDLLVDPDVAAVAVSTHFFTTNSSSLPEVQPVLAAAVDVHALQNRALPHLVSALY